MMLFVVPSTMQLKQFEPVLRSLETYNVAFHGGFVWKILLRVHLSQFLCCHEKL